MSNEILAILVMGIIAGIVIIAWRIRSGMDKGNEGLKDHSVLSEAARKRQILASIERLERKQTEMSIKLDQILEAKSKTVKKEAKKTTKARKTISKKKG